MANIFVTEYSVLGSSQFGPTQAPLEPTLAAYSFATSGASSGPSAPNQQFQNGTALIEVHVDGPCCIAIGIAPVAALGVRRMTQNQTKYLTIPKGAGFSIAGITST
jgi:hypothetical protein